MVMAALGALVAVMALRPRCSWLALTAGTAAAATVLLAAAVATVLLATVLLAVAVATVLAAAVAAAVSMTDPPTLLEVELPAVVIAAAGPQPQFRIIMTLAIAVFAMTMPLAPFTVPAAFDVPFPRQPLMLCPPLLPHSHLIASAVADVAGLIHRVAARAAGGPG